MSNTLPKRSEDYAGWYNALIKTAGLAEPSPVRGCMTIKPYGFALWERMQSILDAAFKRTGHVNAYFPLFIPQSFLSQEAQHVEGFAKECAVVTHYRLKHTPDGKKLVVDPQAQLEEPLVVRPTSETLVWSTYKGWIQSYRDLPLLINQWSNVVRWEMRTRLFLRTTEILWQEGHTAHATREEAEAEVIQMLEVYQEFAKDYMATPVLCGTKTAHERFAGAESTYTLEALMQDGKALQLGTSHFLGQKFSKAFDVTFATPHGTQEYVWGTSWGVTSRLIGALAMTHSDDRGLVLPPRLAPVQAVVIPVGHTDTRSDEIHRQAIRVQEMLSSQGVRTKLDDDLTRKPGWKYAQHELQGVPIRIVVGPRDVSKKTAELCRRDNRDRCTVDIESLVSTVSTWLDKMQEDLYQNALSRQRSQTTAANSYEELKDILDAKGGFVLAHWDGCSETEKRIQQETKATIRCIPLEGDVELGRCIYTGNPSKRRVAFARAY